MIKAPYNFVPLSKFVYFPDWADQVSHDIPFSDGISGTIECTLITESPIYVRNGGNWKQEDKTNPEWQSFFKVSNDYIIPGTSIKGMLRNVIEIITFGKMGSKVDDKTYSIRDLSPAASKIYGKKMTEGNSPGPYTPRVKAGWLSIDKESGRWLLTQCQYARVEQDDLIKYHGGRLDLKNRQTAVEKYNKWTKPLEIDFATKDPGPNDWQHSCGLLKYTKALNLKSGKKGTIVFTGQPMAHEFSVVLDHLPNGLNFDDLKERIAYKSRDSKLVFKGMMSDSEKDKLLKLDNSNDASYKAAIMQLYNDSYTTNTKKRKHMEFIFYDKPDSKPIPLNEKLQKEFEFIHADSKNPNTENEEWSRWKQKLENQEPVPVFFLSEASNPLSMGLAMMYRLPYDYSIHKAIEHTSIAHVQCSDPDLADTLFGFIGMNDDLKGRVSLSHAIAKSAEQDRQIETVLGTPKPTYYPNYIKQQVNAEGRVDKYKTFMNEKCEIRGWKRYPAKNVNPTQLARENMGTDNVSTIFIPLKKGAGFDFKIRFHNLKPVELGALIWTLRWGGSDLCHSIGMGKPFGYGQVKVAIKVCNFFDCKRDKITDIIDTYQKAFEDHMDGQVPGWKDTEQLVQLKAMANHRVNLHGTTPAVKLKYMKLGMSVHDNEFRTAKDALFCLTPHANFIGISDDVRFKDIKVDCPEASSIKPKTTIINAKRSISVASEEPQSLSAKFNSIKNKNDLKALFGFFRSLIPSDLAEFEGVDISAVQSVLNVGQVDALAALEIAPEIKMSVAQKMLGYTKPNKNWKDDKHARYQKLKEIAGV